MADPPAPGKDKSDPHVERIIERLADYVTLELMFKKNVEAFALDRTAGLEENLGSGPLVC